MMIRFNYPDYYDLPVPYQLAEKKGILGKRSLHRRECDIQHEANLARKIKNNSDLIKAHQNKVNRLFFITRNLSVGPLFSYTYYRL